MATMKKFLIIGNGNAVTYKEIFPPIKAHKIWLGASKGLGGCMEFVINADVFDASKCSNYREENGKYYIKIMLSTWFTNIPHKNMDKPPLNLAKHYNADDYPHYDNYDAINVDKVKDIPMDYDGVMGVPITFLDKYNPNQFEIIGLFNDYKECDYELGLICGLPMECISKNGKVSIHKSPLINKMAKYRRLLIKRKKIK